MWIKKLLIDYKAKCHMKKIKDYTNLNMNSFYGANFRIDLRHTIKNHSFMKTGNHDIIDGKFIFERETGYISLGDRVHIGNSTFISINRIDIGNDVTIAWDCLFYDHNSHSVKWSERCNDTEQEYRDIMTYGNAIKNKDWSNVKSAPIKICDKVWIGYGATILKGVSIGEGAVVAARSVVTKDVEAYTLVAGNPARLISHITEDN